MSLSSIVIERALVQRNTGVRRKLNIMFSLCPNKNNYIGCVFTRRNGGCDRRAVMISSYTKSGLVRYRELEMIRICSTNPDIRNTFDTQYINAHNQSETEYTSQWQLCVNDVNGTVVILEKNCMQWDLVTDFEEGYCAHPIGFTPGCATNFR